jgi:oligoribonuclease
MLAIFLDQETTGLDPARHRTIEIAFKIVDVSTDEVIASYDSVVKLSREAWDRHDPTSMKINGFLWETICGGKELELVSNEIKHCFIQNGIARGKAVFICQNPSFDRAFFNHLVSVDEQEKLKWPYHWLDLASMYWAARMWKAKNTKTPFPEEIILSKDKIAEYYGLPPEKKPHKAMNGVDHLIICYQALFNYRVARIKDF